jgi:hypothetical protein
MEDKRKKEVEKICFGIINLIDSVPYNIWMEGFAYFFAFLTDRSKEEAKMRLSDLWVLTRMLCEYPESDPWEKAREESKEFEKWIEENRLKKTKIPKE